MEDLVGNIASSPLSWRTAPITPATPDSTMLEDNQQLDTLTNYGSAKELSQDLRHDCKSSSKKDGVSTRPKTCNIILIIRDSCSCFVVGEWASNFSIEFWCVLLLATPIPHISFVSMMLVHPKYAMRAQDDYRCLIPPALTYPRHILFIMGPSNAN